MSKPEDTGDMNQSNKALRDILGCACSYTEQYDSKSYNLKTEEYEDCECVAKIPQVYALVTNHIKGALPEKKKLVTDVDEDDIGEFGEPHNFCVECGQYEIEGKLECPCTGYNQALDEVNKVLAEVTNADQ